MGSSVPSRSVNLFLMLVLQTLPLTGSHALLDQILVVVHALMMGCWHGWQHQMVSVTDDDQHVSIIVYLFIQPAQSLPHQPLLHHNHLLQLVRCYIHINFDTDCLMMVYFHVVSVSVSATAQSPSITLSSLPPSGELTVGACHDVYSVCLCRH